MAPATGTPGYSPRTIYAWTDGTSTGLCTYTALLEKVDTMMQAQEEFRQEFKQEFRQEFLGRLAKIERRLSGKPPVQDSPSSSASRMRLPSLLSDPEGVLSPRPSVGQPSPASAIVPIIPMLTNRDPPATFPENVASGDHRQYPDPIVSDDQSDEVEAGLPADHTTAAHQLLTQWAKVMRPFFKGTGVDDEHYVMRLEHGRGVLRPYGWGEGDDLGDGGHQLGSPAGSSDRDTYSPAPSPREGLWGTGLSPAANVEVKRSDPTLAGDLNPNGSLKLDKPTVDRLFASYMRNIHILHPFLNEIRIRKMIEVFANRYSSDVVSVKSPGFAVQSLTSQPLKRKRSNGGTPGLAFSSMPEPGFPNSPKPSLERSISSAIVLLVLALGRICEHKQPLPGPMETPASSTDIHGMPGMDSPLAAYRASPASSHSTLASTSSPSNEPMRFAPSRRPSLEALPASEQPTYVKKNRNVDIIPGFAYYARASDILGNLHGGNDLSHAQANLLAGLYMGQLARVMESWEWIFSASIKCRILIEQVIGTNPNALSRNTTAKGQKLVHEDLIKFCFWTCLQLESGIGQYEQKVAWPTGVREDLAEAQKLPPHVETIMLYYSAQIHLRKELNRVHRILYSKKEKSKRSKRGGWANVADPAILQDMLEAWRETLPPSFQWNDSDPAPEDINAARLRAKYYGAKYIITRPFLYRAVVEMKPRPDLLVNVDQDPQGMQRSGSNNSGTPSSGPPRFEQNLSTEDARAVIEASRVCVQAAMKSTVAFDGLKTPDGQKSRPVVTNIFGTAHAQYGNMLVLAATHNSWLKPLIPREELDRLLDRTINFLDDLAPISPTMKANAAILRNTKAVIHSAGTSVPLSAHSSFAER
ncbi:hypothetical protein H2199_000991 [Coniosporium tulheliwenetii]|uniref:Uncharacterized protein n=1 Tax=Coniosporium tulheliwenetii TaxID=3383036 RepID=A0ACC2ZNP2_9PEZI|nr:hypothetical protein H2199_000991 [Cladosporium sp. JES 115]